MKKRVVSLALLSATTSLMALGGEFAYLYKDPRIMGMGGTNIAVGSYSTSIFSNPAGLTNISKEHGFVVDILSIGAQGSAKSLEFINDVNNAETENDIVDVLEKYSGEHFSFGVNNYTSISKNSEIFAWSIGLLAATDLNMQAHPNSGPSGLLATSSRGYGGVTLGVAKPFETEFGRVDVGIGAKFIVQQSYEGSLLVSDLMNDSNDIVQTLRDKFEKQSYGIGADLGVTYHPFEESMWHPAIGMSVLNIGAMSMDDNYGFQPMTVNFGVSIAPEVSFMHKLVLAADYVDAFNANVIRDYTYNDEGEVSYKDYTDSDVMKRVRLGAELGLIDKSFLTAALNVGLYQGAYTAGLNMELSVLKLNAATYEEQIGTGDVEINDRRYMVQLGVGW